MDSTQRVKGFKFLQQEWIILNRLRTGHRKCGYMIYDV